LFDGGTRRKRNPAGSRQVERTTVLNRGSRTGRLQAPQGHPSRRTPGRGKEITEDFMSRHVRFGVLLFIVLALPVLALVSTVATAQMQWTSQDGKSTMKFGILVQPQAEWLETGDTNHYQQNLYLRRMRLIFGGNINENWSFFVDTDSPKLGYAKTDGTKTSDFYIQDAIVTYSFGDPFKVDMGMILVPMSHNTTQSAASLLTVDYGPYSFLSSDETASKVGRDYGMQLRGYLFSKHFEYRAGVFQGYRGKEVKDTEGVVTQYQGVQPFRYTLRAVWYPFEADTGFFYTGTTLGTKHILAVGASYDAQRDYKTVDFDVFYDHPFKNGDGLTLQADWMKYDGGDFFPVPVYPAAEGETWSCGTLCLAKRDALLFEAGYYFKSVKFGPFAQYASQQYDNKYDQYPLYGQQKYTLGAAYWGNGHKFNVKVAGAKILSGEPGVPSHYQYTLQAQIFTY
jgi:hypothetical protein